jgi:uncharacterized membrane protein YccC
MEILGLLLVPEAFFGTLLGIAAASLVHWLAPDPEPVLVEAGLVALGFIAGLAVSHWWSTKDKLDD